ncbi:nitrate- and nitrite sensing domain-containing protein [Verrucosispora sp. WMMA2121]|uniref:sensor histidine kinase n=1 Tax=Verrucosispora sp. WMMA2121 TaxID=3015164 RepID=UPI0022B65975|nr:nitrate- and nitrite sensing domain-containing protein [Verrucosispora sp. WMMA2121]MCZ7423941.1 nitrate- and nitrite sensing domain-containing protein [Verrucosispora sp. WMMA2121]
MGSRSRSLRTKVVALLAALVALWGFTAWVTVRDGVDLLGMRALDVRVFDPTEPLLLQLQLERRTSLVYLGRPNETTLDELTRLRARTDQLAAEYVESSDHWQVGLLGSDALHDRLAESKRQLAALPDTRAAVDGRNIGRGVTGTAFTELIESFYEVYDELGNVDDDQIADDTTQLIRLNQARELLSQEDALLAGVLAAGRITPAERAEFTRIVGARQFLAEQAVVRLPDADQRRYEQLVTGTSFRRLADLETRIMNGTGTARPPFSTSDWSNVTAAALIEIGDMVLAGGDDVVSNATPVAIGVIVRLVLAAGLGLLVVIAAVVVSITTARARARRWHRLRDAALQFADERLPRVAERLGRGEQVDIAEEAPPLRLGDDEIGQVGRALDVVRQTAVRTAVEQAELRRAAGEVFLGLARRTQALVHHQLTLLDAMERREHDAEELEDLFRVDHLATRARRHTENLITLGGATPGRAWRRGVPMVDVVRGAVGEVEDYPRVTVREIADVSLAGPAVGAVIHLLAELIENGVTFSPPHTSVEVRGQPVANGFAVEIEDRGPGMTEADRAAANHRIGDGGELTHGDASRLGLYVVSRLATRHGVRVRLRESAYGGTTAVVLIPSDLIIGDESEPSVPGKASATGADGSGPSTEPRGGPAQSAALNGPTVPTGLPVTTASVHGSPWQPRRSANPGPSAGADPAGQPTEPGHLTASGIGLTRTESGLPVRVRQASLAPALRAEPEAVAEGDDTIREPEQVRRMMSSYQTGTRRGRSDAARLLGAGGRPGPDDESDDADQQET